MSENRVEKLKEAVKRKRGDLVELDYFRVANYLISENVFTNDLHKTIKRSRQSDSGRMDNLMDFIFESKCEKTLVAFVNSVDRQNNELAEMIRDDFVNNVYEGPSTIEISTDIFENSQPETSDDHDFEILYQSQPRNNENGTNANASSGTDDNVPEDDSIPFETQLFEPSSLPYNVCLTLKEVKDRLNGSFTSCKFVVDPCWVKELDTLYYREGRNIVYKGCAFRFVESQKLCLKNVKTVKSHRNVLNEPDTLYECQMKHRSTCFENVPFLKFLTLEDRLDSLKGIKMFSKDVENFLDVRADEIALLDHEGVLKMVDNLRSCNFKILLKCLPPVLTSSQISSSLENWDIVATVIQRRTVAPNLRASATQ